MFSVGAPRRGRAAILALLCALLGALAVAGPAAADGDPASDVLLGTNVFYPYSPTVSAGLQHTLDAETRAIQRSGLPLKVALIASPVDLGVVPDLFGHPQKYAEFLDQEISYMHPQPLLVVMPAGYGGKGLAPAAQAALGPLSKPAGPTSDDLARAAITAVSRVARASGHPVRGVAGVPGAEGSSSGTTVLVIALAVLAVAVAGALLVLTVQQRRRTAGDRA